jgi:hypothetical protein
VIFLNFFNSGEVAFIVGGDGTTSVEVYSPDGKCQHSLAPIPVETPGKQQGVDVMITIFSDFSQFSARKIASVKKRQFLRKNMYF